MRWPARRYETMFIARRLPICFGTRIAYFDQKASELRHIAQIHRRRTNAGGRQTTRLDYVTAGRVSGMHFGTFAKSVRV